MAPASERRPAVPDERVRGILRAARLVALDVDGTLTDGRIGKGALGAHDELLSFHVHDGIALQWLMRAGIKVVWITGRSSLAAAARAQELGIDELARGVQDKAAALAELQGRFGIGREATIAMGDDLPDLAFLSGAALLVAPSGAREEVRARAGLVTQAGGGEGAVRELAEQLLRAQERWQGLVDAAAR